MKNVYILISVLFTSIIFAQERVKTYDIVTNRGIAYKKSNTTIFSGIAESRKSNGHLNSEKEYIDGFLNKYTLYYNINEKVISSETFYHKISGEKKKHITYPHKGNLKTVTVFDENGEKLLEEHYIDDALVYHCEYLNGKKHGTIYSIDNDNIKSICQYDNGKRISSSKEKVNVR